MAECGRLRAVGFEATSCRSWLWVGVSPKKSSSEGRFPALVSLFRFKAILPPGFGTLLSKLVPALSKAKASPILKLVVKGHKISPVDPSNRIPTILRHSEIRIG